MWEVNEAFEKDYDAPSYEAKMASVAATAGAQASARGELDTWTEAIQVLRREDHYLLTLLAAPLERSEPPLRDRLKLIGTALLIVLFIMAGIILFSSRR